ncbi:CGNR zinc finger domain-containing protein [Actinoplanes sp. NPDC051494]|uniref:CGNR zinc finger domain-containing protein n=1 Tax=Actinoplanes sp. NPDC051494 TaxID=3363907 RepID=UPI00378E1CFC
MTVVFVSGRPSLDFAGTLKWRRRPRGEEQLPTPGHLADWPVSAGLTETPMSVTDEQLGTATATREAIYRTVRARLDGRAPDSADVTRLNELAHGPRITPRLHPDGRTTRAGTVGELLATLAADLLDLLAGPEIDRVKGCANPECTRIYVDASRLGNRQWCGMAECGNRAKVGAYRARKRENSR